MLYNNFLKNYVKVKSFLGSRKGQAMTEYGLVIALIAVAAIIAITAMSGKLTALFSKITTSLEDAAK